MADTLKTFTEIMDGLPDNTTRLISPQNVREAVLSATTDRGAAYADEAALPIVVPIVTQNVWVDIPQALILDTPGSMIQYGGALFWRMDANGHLVYDYAADYPNVTVPPGYERAVRMDAALSFDPAGGGVYELAMTIDGTPIPPFISVDAGNQTIDVDAAILGGQPLIVADAPIVSVAIRNTAGTQDATLKAFAYGCRGGIPAS